MTNKVVSAILFTLAALFLYSFFQLYEYVETDIDLGYTREAKINPYLAAQQLLEKRGVSTESSSETLLLNTLPDNASLFVASAGMVRGEQLTEQLLEWVSGGGHLIVGASSEPKGRQNQLIKRLGIEVEKIEAEYPHFDNCQDNHDGANPDNSIEEQSEKLSDLLEELNRAAAEHAESQNNPLADVEPFRTYYENCLDQEHLTALDFDGYEDSLFTHIKGSFGFITDQGEENGDSPEPFYYASDAAGIRFLQLELGGGLVSLLASGEIWRSTHLRMFDNAFLLTILAGNDVPFYILYGGNHPSLFALLTRYGWEALLLLLAMLIFWLWRKGLRTSPVYDPIIQQRRSIQEHLNARSNYLWAHDEFAAILSPLQRDIEYYCTTHLPAFQSASADERIAIIAEKSRLNRQLVKQLFHPPLPINKTACEQAIRAAQTIRKRL